MRCVRRGLVATWLLLGATAAGAQQQPEVVSLRFGWPERLLATVEQEWSRTRSTPERTDSIRVLSHYQLEVHPHAQGRLIRTGSFSTPQIQAARSDETGFVERLFGQMSAFSPSYVVSADGEFVRVEDIQRMKAAVDSLFDPLFREWGEVPPEALQFLQSMVSEEALSQSAAQEWNLLVGTWVGAEWEPGLVYALEAEEPSPLVPGLMISMEYEFGITERVKCTPDARREECVVLRMYSTADQEAVREATRRFIDSMGIADAEEMFSSLASMNVEHDLTVISDPRTLLPYYLELIKLVEVESAESGGPLVQEDRRVYRYSYRK